MVRGQPLTPVQRQAYIDRYDGEIAYMDASVGRLLAALRGLGRYDDALTIVVGDHGELFGEHQLLDHGHALYEGLLRVPLLVHFPGGRGAGTSEQRTVSLIDLLPLIAEEVGMPLPAEAEGLPVGRRSVAFSECRRGAFHIHRYGAGFDRDLQSVVRWPWKLIVSTTGSAELYRLDRDPHERINLSGDPVEDELLAALAAERRTLRPVTGGGRLDALTPEVVLLLRQLGYLE